MLFILVGIFGSNNKVSASYYLFLYTFNLKCKITKHRKSPKALVTKVIRVFLLLAWLMPQGRVKSLVFTSGEKLLWVVVDMWVITVLSHPFLKEGVKEQRVDGYLNSINLDFIRCTLVAGKPVLRRKTHYHFDNKIILRRFICYEITAGKTLTIKKFICTRTRSNIDPWFITGFVEAEGCFALGFFKSDSYKMGYQIQAIFKITLHKKDYDLLIQIKDYFGVGQITKHGDTTLQYIVRSLKDLNIIISHFDKYPLISQKAGDYILFKDAISLIKTKEHLTK